MKANEILKAADDARLLLRGFKALADVSAALELAGSAMQAREEAEAALKKLRAEMDAVKAELAQASDDVTAAREGAASIMAHAKDEAAAIRAAAESDAKATRAAAEADAKARKAEIAAQCDEASKAVKQAESLRDAMAAEVKELEAKAEKARAFLAKLAG